MNINDVTDAIQLALAPVFLLTGIAGLLNVMAGRLARIIDRGRHITEGSHRAPADITPSIESELRVLDRRRHLTSSAITACTLAALLVCVVIGTLFLEVMLDVRLEWLVGLAFTAATVALITGLALFLREVHLATTSIRIVASLPRP
ncbi:MAG: DUF2721 domain-containing protein [Longimicrobiales bacterium]